MAAHKPDVDWNAVQALYRTDQLSLREIGKRYGVSNVAILKRATKEGWAKDLRGKVVDGIRQAVVSSSLAKGRSANQTGRVKHSEEHTKAVLDAAIKEGRDVVLGHQSLGSLLTQNSRKLALIIKQRLAQYKGLDNNEVAVLARAHESLSRASVNSVQIERQSRGLDDLPADPSAPPSISITYYRSDLVLNNNQAQAAELAPAIEIKKLK